jgi:hypothetical protein
VIDRGENIEVRMPSTSLPEWLAGFGGEELDGALNRAAILATVDDQGWPHQAYLGAGEILAHSTGVSLALWESSRTTANIMRDGRAVLYIAALGSIWEARTTLKRRQTEGLSLAVFDGAIVGTRRHSAPYADVIGLLEFQLHDRQSTLDRWRKQIQLLRGD